MRSSRVSPSRFKEINQHKSNKHEDEHEQPLQDRPRCSKSRAEFEMGVHDSPFVCADHNQPPRRFIIQFLGQERYGAVFEKFIERTVAHFAVPTDSNNATAWRTRKTEDDNAVAAMN